MLRFMLPALLLISLSPPATCQKTTPLHPHSQDASAGTSPAQQPLEPPARTVRDFRTRIFLDLPAGWNLSRMDGELSTFHLDARTAPRKAELSLVADLAYNPYPSSTFSGALFYLSLTPKSSSADCLAQATAKPAEPAGTALVGDISFHRGNDSQVKICTVARDTIYTVLRHGSCIRFDLVINNFCGGEASGALDLTESQLTNIQQRLETILKTARIGR